jgi:hypothetical protein
MAIRAVCLFASATALMGILLLRPCHATTDPVDVIAYTDHFPTETLGGVTPFAIPSSTRLSSQAIRRPASA